MMDSLIDKLQGKKKYLVLAVAAAIWFCDAIGLLPPGSFDEAMPVLVMAGGAAVGDTMNRMAQD